MAASSSTERPKYVPLREDQFNDLTALARELQAVRTRKVERITENTLIRVAIDVLLAHSDLLAGDTEEELLTNALRRLKQLKDRERQEQ